MGDELSYLNVLIDFRRQEIPNINGRLEKIISKVLINSILGKYWVSVVEIKQNLGSFIKEIERIDLPLNQYTEKNGDEFKYRIKDSLISEFDPYTFTRYPNYQSEITNQMQEKYPTHDIISGNQNSDVPQYLKDLQNSLLQSDLLSFLSSLVLKQDEISQINSYIRPVLKLTLMSLQNYKSSKNSENNLSFKELIFENFVSNEYKTHIGNLLEKDGLDNCKQIIEKIKALLSEIENQDKIVEERVQERQGEEEGQSQRAKKSKEQLMKQKQIMQQFQQMQKRFAQKNLEIASNQASEAEELKIPDEESALPTKRNSIIVTEIDESRTCHFCNQEIDLQNDFYGFPIYISFTNNFYEESQLSPDQKFAQHLNVPSDDIDPIVKLKWWPVIRSCFHMHHVSCFEKNAKATRAEQNSISLLFQNRSDSYCSFCKTLNNNFVVAGYGNADITNDFRDLDGQPLSQEALEAVRKDQRSLIDLNFWQTCQELIQNWRQQMMLGYKNDRNNFRLFFRRSFEYFIEKSCGLSTSSSVSKVQLEVKMHRAVFNYSFSVGKDDLIDKEDILTRYCLIEQLKQQQQQKEQRENNVVQDENNQFKNYLQADLDQLLMQNLYSLMLQSLSRSHEIENLIKENCWEIIQSYLCLIMIRVLFNNRKHSQNNNEQTIINIFIQQQNEEVVNLVKKEFLKSIMLGLKKILFCLICTSIKNSDDLIELILQLEPSEKSILSILEITFNTSIDSIESLIKQNKKLKILENSQIQAYFNQEINQDMIVAQQGRVMKHKIIELPPNFFDFNTKYYQMRCTLCNQHSLHLAICLTCGQTFCSQQCVINGMRQKRGNLVRHAKKYHLQSAIFMMICHQDLVMVYGHKNQYIKINGIYVDQYGQPSLDEVQSDRSKTKFVDFAKFNISTTFLSKLQKMVEQQAYDMQIFDNARKDNRLYNENSF